MKTFHKIAVFFIALLFELFLCELSTVNAIDFNKPEEKEFLDFEKALMEANNVKRISSLEEYSGEFSLKKLIVYGEIDNTWDKNPWTPSRIVLENNYSFEKVELDSNYYVMFKIYDVDNLYTYSDLIQVK